MFQRRLMQIVVVLVCHVLVPLCLAATGFLVTAVISRNFSVSVTGAVVAAIAAWFTSRSYTLRAIGPRFVDRDDPIQWSFIGNRLMRLFLWSLLTPVAVLAIYLGTVRFTRHAVAAAVLGGLAALGLVYFVLGLDAQDWAWRVRRGRVIQTHEEIHAKIDAHCQRSGATETQSEPWAGMMIPSDLMAAHTKIFGMTGSGKTITIRLRLQWLVGRCTVASKVKLVVFDPKRELYNYILGMVPQVPVYLFDATDCRGLAWDIAADVIDPNHAKEAAKLLVPDESTSQPYFPRSARRILEWVLRYLVTHASRWNLQDVFMILDDVDLLRRIIPRRIVRKYFKPETTLKNTLSTLDTLTSRFETVAACWAHAEQEGRTLSLREFEAAPGGAILVIPRRLDLADAMDPTIRLIFERLIHLWLARPDLRFLPADLRPETHVILDETAKAGKLARLDELLLMGRSKGVLVTLAAQDVEAMREEYGDEIAGSLLAQCGNAAIFALESPLTREYCASLFGTHEVRERPRTFEAPHVRAALKTDPKDLYHPGELRELKTLLSSEFASLPSPAQTGRITGYFITGGLGAHYASYPIADLLLPPANIPDLVPRDAADQEFPERLTSADLRRLGIPDANQPAPPSPSHPSTTPPTSTTPSTDSLRSIQRQGGD